MAGQGRVAVKEMVDKSAEQDPEYNRLVTEIKEANTKSGWLIGAGAFDRQDLQYLADFKEAERQKEIDIRDIEAIEFAKLRSRIEGNEAAATGVVHMAVREKKEMKPTAKLLPTVKVLGSKDSETEPARKRSRTLSMGVSDSLVSGLSRELSVGSQQGGVIQSGNSSAAPSRQESLQVESLVSYGIDDAEEEKDQEGLGLGGLLGGYDSSDSDDAGAAAPVGGVQQGVRQAARLPSAAELFEDFEVPGQPAAQTGGTAAQQGVKSSSDSSGSGSDSD